MTNKTEHEYTSFYDIVADGDLNLLEHLILDEHYDYYDWELEDCIQLAQSMDRLDIVDFLDDILHMYD